MDCRRFIEARVKEMVRTVGDARIISALSGGVDSAVCTVLAHGAVGKQMSVIFIDDGLMRQDEPRQVKKDFAALGIEVEILDAKKAFFRALRGITDPEEKRKAFRDRFYKTLGRAVKDSKAQYLLQGTIKADIIETKKGVKTQHNILEQIGIDPKKGYGFRTIEPLKTLFKPGVRAVGKALGMPKQMYERMPFPGPGLATRTMGLVTPARVEIVRQACRIVEEETARVKCFQAFAVLMSDQATGVTDDGRRADGHIIAVRCVDSTNAIKAKATKLPWAKLERIQKRIVKEIPSVTKVLYDLTGKPPSTIEYI